MYRNITKARWVAYLYMLSLFDHLRTLIHNMKNREFVIAYLHSIRENRENSLNTVVAQGISQKEPKKKTHTLYSVKVTKCTIMVVESAK